jgi:hypothetical protein
MTKRDEVVNTNSAEVLYGPPMISHLIPKVFKNKFTKCTYYWFRLRVFSVKDSHMIYEMTKCDKVVDTNSAEVLYDPPMISHEVPKVFQK